MNPNKSYSYSWTWANTISDIYSCDISNWKVWGKSLGAVVIFRILHVCFLDHYVCSMRHTAPAMLIKNGRYQCQWCKHIPNMPVRANILWSSINYMLNFKVFGLKRSLFQIILWVHACTPVRLSVVRFSYLWSYQSSKMHHQPAGCTIEFFCPITG